MAWRALTGSSVPSTIAEARANAPCLTFLAKDRPKMAPLIRRDWARAQGDGPGLIRGVSPHQGANLQARVDAELGKDLPYVRAGGTYLHTQVAGHLLSCQAIHDAAQSFPLPRGEELQPPLSVPV